MKTVVGILAALLIACLGIGTFLHLTAKTREHTLVNRANDVQSENESLRAEIEGLLSTLRNLRHQLDAAQSDAARNTEAADAGTKRIAELEQLLSLAEAAQAAAEAQAAELEQLLSRVKTDQAAAEAQAAALAEFISRREALATIVNVQLTTAWGMALGKQNKLVESPTKESYSAFVAELPKVSKVLEMAENNRKSLEEYMLDKRDLLRSADSGLRNASDRLSELRNWLAELRNSLSATSKSCRESSFAVLANQGWQSTDLNVELGEVVVVKATGSWLWAPSRGEVVGPLGEDGNTSYRIAEWCNNGALIGRIRGSDRVDIAVGLFVPDRAGKLELRINDTHVNDNRGTVDATMWVFKPLIANR